jgi:thiamine-monophosphate kinase
MSGPARETAATTIAGSDVGGSTGVSTDGLDSILGEFDRIKRFFVPLAAGAPEALGLTDDAALIDLAGEGMLAVSADAIVAGVHFLPDDPADLVARKALRVNLSDMAAMAATPRFYTMTTALPKTISGHAVETWLEGFARGLAVDQEAFGISLIGGDSVSTPGPVSISVTIFGTVVSGRVLRRNGAAAGDDIWVSGTIGDGAAGLMVAQGMVTVAATVGEAGDVELADRYRLPRPRVGLGCRLGGIASAGLDVSDGLLQDLGHIMEESGLSARVERDAVPLSPPLAALLEAGAVGWDDVLAGGDDYELLFTAPPEARGSVERAGRESGTPITRIGRVEKRGTRLIEVLDADGAVVETSRTGWRHA